MRRLVLLLVAGVGLAACEDTIQLQLTLTGLEPSEAAIALGDSIRLVPSLFDPAGSVVVSDSRVEWTTSDASIATVDDSGVVTGLADGEVSIVAKLDGVSQVSSIEVWAPATVTMARDSAVAPLMHRMAVELDAPAQIEVDYWTGGSDRFRVTSDESDAEPEALLGRLVASTTYQYEVRTIGPRGLRGPASAGEFTTDALPAGLAEVEFVAEGDPSVPLTMLELRALNFLGFVVVDGAGQVVWYWETEGAPQGSARRANGNFVLIDRGGGLREVSADHRVVGELTGPMDPQAIHHDVITTPNNTVLFLTLDGEETVQDTTWISDRVWEWDREADLVALRWSTFDFYDIVADRRPRSRPDDWGHANAISLGQHGNLIMSLHWLNQIISIAPGYESIEWKLGGLGSDFALDTTDAFSGQHTAAEVSEGRVLLFDNGFEREATPDEYSRALELELDLGAGTATRAWEFRASPDQYSRVISSARRLDNGNTLSMFGFRTAVPRTAYEVAPNGSVVWKLEVLAAATSTVYRANPVEHIAGEVIVEPPVANR